jgi:cell fate (sporulation/competence/biofilm development) regulator YlbF (YheA/YmcA/DUF963 family)
MMNIQTVADNLRRTIAGKEKYLAECKDALDKGITSTGVHIAVDTTREFLEINIGELRRILKDVESCIAKDVEQSWRDNPDRSGGQFTQDEIENANRW